MSTLFNKLLELLAKHLGGKKSQIPISCHACMLSHFSHIRLCNLPDCSPPGCSVHGILHARILEWVAISSSRGSSKPRDQTRVSYISCVGRRVLYQPAPPWKTHLMPHTRANSQGIRGFLKKSETIKVKKTNKYLYNCRIRKAVRKTNSKLRKCL